MCSFFSTPNTSSGGRSRSLEQNSNIGVEMILKIAVWLGFALLVLLCALWGLEKVNQARDNDRFPPKGDFVTVSSKELHRLCEGAPSKITVWFEAGAGGTSLDWRLVAPEVAQFARVCSYDRAGLGWSEKQSGERDLEAILGELHQMIQSETDDQIILVGHSFGGFLTQAYARIYPEKVAWIVLVDSLEVSFFEKYAAQSKSQIGMMRMGAVLSHLGLPRLLGLAQTPRDTPAVLKPEILARAVRPNALSTVSDEAAMMPQNVAYFAALPAVSSDMPVTIISRVAPSEPTSFDQDWQTAQAQLAQAYPSARTVISAHENHYIQFSEPELIVRHIKQMVDPLLRD